MTNDEAERLARELLNSKSMYVRPLRPQIERLCNFILSGDMKREIENAAFELAANLADRLAIGVAVEIAGQTHSLGVLERRPADAQASTASAIAAIIRSLIQPPAQTENGE